MVSFYDYLNIGFYFLFIAGVGIYFSRRSKNTSDYFRGLRWIIQGKREDAPVDGLMLFSAPAIRDLRPSRVGLICHSFIKTIEYTFFLTRTENIFSG